VHTARSLALLAANPEASMSVLTAVVTAAQLEEVKVKKRQRRVARGKKEGNALPTGPDTRLGARFVASLLDNPAVECRPDFVWAVFDFSKGLAEVGTRVLRRATSLAGMDCETQIFAGEGALEAPAEWPFDIKEVNALVIATVRSMFRNRKHPVLLQSGAASTGAWRQYVERLAAGTTLQEQNPWLKILRGVNFSGLTKTPDPSWANPGGFARWVFQQGESMLRIPPPVSPRTQQGWGEARTELLQTVALLDANTVYLKSGQADVPNPEDSRPHEDDDQGSVGGSQPRASRGMVDTWGPVIASAVRSSLLPDSEDLPRVTHQGGQRLKFGCSIMAHDPDQEEEMKAIVADAVGSEQLALQVAREIEAGFRAAGVDQLPKIRVKLVERHHRQPA